MKPHNNHCMGRWGLVSGFPVLVLLLMAFLPADRSATLDREMQTAFSLVCLERVSIDFNVTEPGNISADAEWLPADSPAVLLLYGPGQMNYYLRKEGKSGQKLEFTVTERHITRGSEWSVVVLNQQDTKISGLLKVHFPGEEPK
jgi:hypothetical protein